MILLQYNHTKNSFFCSTLFFYVKLSLWSGMGFNTVVVTFNVKRSLWRLMDLDAVVSGGS